MVNACDQFVVEKMDIKKPGFITCICYQGEEVPGLHRKYTNNMDQTHFFSKVFSINRMQKYLDAHPDNESLAIKHYQCNIEISESFYTCLSVFEVSLRNAINRELITKFDTEEWYNHFPSTVGLSTLTKEISLAQMQITKRYELVTPPKVVAELTFGFWTRLFNSEFELILWKELRRAFPYMPKVKKQRKYISAPINNFRNFRNRIFHNEPICWKLSKLKEIHDQMVEVLGWINKDLPDWIAPFDRFNSVLQKVEKQLYE